MKTQGKSPLLILGAGFFAQELADLVTDANAWEVVGFVEGIDRQRCDAKLLGLPIHWIDDLGAPENSCQALCAIGSPIRKSFIETARRRGLTFATFVHPKAHVSSTAKLAEGTIIGPGAVVGSHTTVGKHVIVNRQHPVYVGREKKIGASIPRVRDKGIPEIQKHGSAPLIYQIRDTERGHRICILLPRKCEHHSLAQRPDIHGCLDLKSWRIQI